MTQPIDWSKHDAYSRNDITCECGAFFKSHSKLVMDEGKMVVATREPCPQCGKTLGAAKRVSSPPERMVLKRGK